MAHQRNGQWRVQSWVAGRRISQSLPQGTPKKIADEIEFKLKMGQIDPSYEKSNIPMFEAFACSFLKDTENERSFSHHKKLHQIFRQHLAPRLGKLRLDSVKREDIVDLQRTLFAKGYKVQSVSNVLACASLFFKEAVFRRHIESSPVSGIKRLKRDKRDFQVWSFEEKDRFLAFVKDVNFKAFQVALLALFTGMRPMELRGLLRDSIDFESCRIHIRRQWCTKQNKLVNYTKTRENRSVIVPQEVLGMLTDKRGLPMSGQIFPEITNSYGKRVLQPLMKVAAVQCVRMHDLRHTFASHLLMKGRNIMEVKELLGHRKLESTMVYLHYSSDRNHDATKCLVEGMSFLAPVVSFARK